MSSLRQSETLDRVIRGGDAASLGIPTRRLIEEAFAAGDREEAERLLDYSRAEAQRVYFIFSTWLRAMLEYGRARIPDFDSRLRDMEARLGEAARLTLGDDVAIAQTGVARLALAGQDPAMLAADLDALWDAYIEVHDNQADWSWALLTVLQEAVGEAAMGQVMRDTMEPWLRERYASLGSMTPEEIFQLTIEGMRAHYVGPGRSGEVIVHDEPDRWVMEFDPCGTGGRMRRGDPARGQAPRTDSPYRFASVEGSYDWTWNRPGVCTYCAHCAVVNEVLPIEMHGTPMRVTDYPENAGDRCRWTVYKDPAFVPLEAFTRVGKQRPGA